MAIAPERNPPINPQYYKPKRFVIEDIVLGVNTLITFTEPHDYVIGQLVRVLIPQVYGCQQLSNQQAYVIAIPTPTQIIIDFNTLMGNQFLAVPPLSRTLPQVVPIGDVNTGYISINGPNVTQDQLGIPGSFKNISPL